MDDTRIKVILRTSMFDRVIDQLIRDEDESSPPERMDAVSIKDLSYKVSNNLRLTVIGSKVNRTVNIMNILDLCEDILHSLVIVLMCDIEYHHEKIFLESFLNSLVL